METQLKIAGSLLIALSISHAFFPKYFKWKEELKKLSLINRQMMSVHVFFIAFALFLMGVLCLIATKGLIQTQLGKTICLGMGLFWFVRLIFQFFVYSPKLWKGKTFETRIHILFSILWIYLTAVYLWIGMR